MRKLLFFFGLPKTLILFTLLPIFFLMFYGEKGTGTERKKTLQRITYGTPSAGTVATLPFDQGRQKGFYKNEGIDLEIVLMPAPILIIALNAGNLDYSMVGGQAMRAGAMGIPVKAVFIAQHTIPQVLVTKPEIKSVKELKGKTIAVPARLDSVYFGAYYILKHHGLDPEKDVVFLPAGPAAMSFNSLVAGAVDAAMITPDQFLMAHRRGFKQLVKTADYIKIPSLGVSASNKKIREKRDEVKRMIRATLKSLLYVRNNKKESIDFLIKEGKMNPEDAPILYDMGLDTFSKDGTVPDEALELQIEITRKSGVDVKDSVSLSQLADFSILREVHKELGLKP